MADTTLVSAWIDGVRIIQTGTSSYGTGGQSVYFIVVPADDPATPHREGGREGDSVVFKIREFEAAERGTWRSGTNVELNLSARPTVTPAAALASIASQLVLVYHYDPSEPMLWKLYDPRAPAYVNRLKRMEQGNGYWIKVSQATTLTYAGRSYRLSPGWNLVGWMG